MQNFFMLTCLVVIAIASPKTPEVQQSEWYQFKSTHQRRYENAEEELKRFGIFNENLQQIEEHNKLYEQGLVAWKMGVNQFTDWTHDEFVSFLATSVHLPSKSVGTFVRPKHAQIPTAVDWRRKGVVTHVKDQGHCGSCWAFSTTGSVEGQNAIKTGKLVALSEQELLDCSDNSGCFGGTLHDSFRYIIKNGLTTEDAYPYEADDLVCRSRNKTRTVHIKGYHDVGFQNETDLQAAVAIIGPVSVLVDSTHWRFYESGIFDRSCSTSSLNHAVLAVGYDTDDKRQDYWLIKNSWGSSWGEQGYMKLPRHQNKCGVATQASYPLL